MDVPASIGRKSFGPVLDPGISTLALRSIAVLVIASAVIGRGLSVALRGWKIGLGDVITRAEQTSATLAQLTVVAGAFLSIRLLVPTIRDREIGIWYRLGVAPVVPAIVTTVFAAATGQLGAALTLALAVGTSVLALTAAAASFGPPETRAAGLVVALAGTGAFVQLVARVLAVRASDAALASLFSMARRLSTAGFAIDVALLLVALLWLSNKSHLRLAVLSAIVTAFGIVVALLAYRGATTLDVTGGIDVLVSRAMAELVRHPRPMIATAIVYAVEASALLLALIAACSRSRTALATVAVALAIAARASSDIPVHGLALALGALLVPLASAHVARTRATPAQSSTETGGSPPAGVQ